MAAGPSDPTSQEVNKASELFRKARELHAAGKAQQAYPLYTEAWKLHHSPDIAANLAMCELTLEKHRDAAEHLEFALKRLLAGTTPEQKARLVSDFEKAKSRIGTVTVNAEPPGSRVTLDGNPIGVAPIESPIFVEPGEHRVGAENSGYLAQAETIVVDKGETRAVVLKLVAKTDGSSSPPPNPGAPQNPNGSGSPANPSEHDVTGEGHWPPTKTAVVIGGAAATVIAAALGIAFKIKGSNADSDADDLLAKAEQQFGKSPCSTPSGPAVDACSQVADKRKSADNANRVSNVGFVAAGAFALGTAAVFFLWPNERAKTNAITAGPWVASRAGGLSFSGSF